MTRFARFNMTKCNPTEIPMDPGASLSSLDSPLSEEEILDMENVSYEEAVYFISP